MCKIHPQKVEIRRTRLTVGGKLIKYLKIFSTLTSDISTFKYLLNSIIPTPNMKFCGAELKDFYLNTGMDTFEYMLIPKEIMK